LGAVMGHSYIVEVSSKLPGDKYYQIIKFLSGPK